MFLYFISGRSRGGSSIVLKIGRIEPPFAKTTMESGCGWVWSAYHNNKKRTPFWASIGPPLQSHTILCKEVDRSALATPLRCLSFMTRVILYHTVLGSNVDTLLTSCSFFWKKFKSLCPRGTGKGSVGLAPYTTSY